MLVGSCADTHFFTEGVRRVVLRHINGLRESASSATVRTAVPFVEPKGTANVVSASVRVHPSFHTKPFRVWHSRERIARRRRDKGPKVLQRVIGSFPDPLIQIREKTIQELAHRIANSKKHD